MVRGRTPDEGTAERCGSCNVSVPDWASYCIVCGAPLRLERVDPIADPAEGLKKRLEAATTGEYLILSELGQGGMGSVFLAVDRTLHRHVAIKVMAPTLVQDTTMQERFRTEARIVATLRHPGIVSIHGFRIVDGLYFFVMDFVEGATLRSVIRAHGPLPIDVVKAVLYDIGSALQHAHQRAGGVIHRDVKPGNVILEPRGHAVVMDFGISKAANTRSGLTMTGAVVGTPEYMSPEQCRGGDITAASDQYSLGLVAYAMLAGAPPFTGQHWSVLAQQATADPRPLKEVRPDCPDEVAAAVERMLAKAARDRFSDVLTAVRALGGKAQEDGAPVRTMIGEIVERAMERKRASTPVAAVAIDGLPDRAAIGDVVTVSVTPLDGVGRALADRRFTLESTEPSVLSVVGVDAVRAVAAGRASIVARCEGAEISRGVLVTAPQAASLSILRPGRAITPGDRVSLRATVVDASGSELHGRAIVWGCSDPSVAQVSRDGDLVALAVGVATVFATCEGQSTSLQVAVRLGSSGGAGDLNTEPVLAARASRAAEPQGRPAPDQTGPRSPGESRTRVGRAAAAGTVAVAALGVWGAMLWTPFGDRTPPAQVPPASAVPVSLDMLNAGNAVTEVVELTQGERLDLDGVVTDAEGAALEATITWSSSAPGVASVDGQGGVLALSSGVATVAAAAAGLIQTVRVQVSTSADPPNPPAPRAEPEGASQPPTVAALAVSRADDGTLVGEDLRADLGASIQLRAQLLSAGGGLVTGARTTWASSNPTVASIDSDGLLRAEQVGTARISVRAADATRQFDVAVIATEPGTLIVTVRPWAYVTIDGVRHGEDQRRLEVSLPPGRHQVRLENPSAPAFDTVIVIRSSVTTTLDRLLASGGG